MAVRKIPVPFCDWCGLPFLPKFLLKDGTRNPIFDHPEQSKRCGKCKRTGWNAGGVDRRRKKPEPVDDVPPVSTQDVIATVCGLEEKPAPQLLKSLDTLAKAAISSRCRHGLFKCRICHPEQAA